MRLVDPKTILFTQHVHNRLNPRGNVIYLKNLKKMRKYYQKIKLVCSTNTYLQAIPTIINIIIGLCEKQKLFRVIFKTILTVAAAF